MFEHIFHWFLNLNEVEIGFVIFFFLFLIFSWSKKTPTYTMTVDKKQFVGEIVKWGLKNIQHEGANKLKKKSVNLEISYYPHKKRYGVYCSYQNKIKVYVNAHKEIDEMIDSSLHELVHHFQYCADPKNFNKRYKLLLDQYSYDKHPMEKEACSIASIYVKSCLKHLINNGFVKQKA
jgi:hypothetical protein